jgi:8-oxo-dGTP pyrophosphatase MutT (NUDIX family)
MSFGNTVHRYKKIYCSNCGIEGHFFRDCSLPITSYGIIAMHQVLDSVKYLLICRRDSLSFIEFVRGKYSISEPTYLYTLLENMTEAEHAKIRSLPFETLWRSVWGSAADTHKTDFENSLRKYKMLDMAAELAAHPAKWIEPEWGFPKGRRNVNESDLAGAIREFKEETNLTDAQFRILHNVVPLVESFRGSNQIQYCHKYYLAISPPDTEVAVHHENIHMSREIGNIGWFTLEEALTKLRPPEKQEILMKASVALKNYIPVDL